MDTDASLLLPLLAVRMLGGESVEKSDPAIKVIGAKFYAEAKQKELLAESKIKVPDPGKFDKKGNPKNKSVGAYSLTEKGKQYLEQAGAAAVQIAEQMARPAEMQKQIEADKIESLKQFKKQLENDRRKLVDEAKKKLAQKKLGGPTKKDWDTLVKKVDELVIQMEKWQPAEESASADADADEYSSAFERLTKRLDETLSTIAKAETHVSETKTAESPAIWLSEAVRYVDEYQRRNPTGYCPLPELFERVAKERSLTIGQFHDGLRQLVQEDKIRLHPFTGAAYQLQNEKYALVAGQEIKYYAERLANA